MSEGSRIFRKAIEGTYGVMWRGSVVPDKEFATEHEAKTYLEACDVAGRVI